MLSTGMRRGEALGLRWADVDLEARLILVQRQLKREGGDLVLADTKTAKSRRAINLPATVADQLHGHRIRQAKERLALGPAWTDSGHVFTSTVGTPIDPRNLYREFLGRLRERRPRSLASARAPTLGRQPHARPGRQAAGGQRGARPLFDPHDRRRLRPRHGAGPSGGRRRHDRRLVEWRRQ